ncbi:uncharacterized protein I206_104526 [Kwoniella pini CBS 10737]|uniref:Uncharacterized protein n=1 Tax=Kwoniella pini CBS 10737 TaxID=1296096 RepID=A0A1B9I770_9TREE|nr:uncharacterized protein I206_02058 [Kwoniella pini CBS 10737]OCF51344.1 hypothetical protein I206_02058 [Kwoniella pini CBS 10737]
MATERPPLYPIEDVDTRSLISIMQTWEKDCREEYFHDSSRDWASLINPRKEAIGRCVTIAKEYAQVYRGTQTTPETLNSRQEKLWTALTDYIYTMFLEDPNDSGAHAEFVQQDSEFKTLFEMEARKHERLLFQRSSTSAGAA